MHLKIIWFEVANNGSADETLGRTKPTENQGTRETFLFGEQRLVLQRREPVSIEYFPREDPFAMNHFQRRRETFTLIYSEESYSPLFCRTAIVVIQVREREQLFYYKRYLLSVLRDIIVSLFARGNSNMFYKRKLGFEREKLSMGIRQLFWNYTKYDSIIFSIFDWTWCNHICV